MAVTQTTQLQHNCTNEKKIETNEFLTFKNSFPLNNWPFLHVLNAFWTIRLGLFFFFPAEVVHVNHVQPWHQQNYKQITGMLRGKSWVQENINANDVNLESVKNKAMTRARKKKRANLQNINYMDTWT